MVFYFSGSGNSYYVASMISENLNTPLISMADALKKREMNFDAREDNVFPPPVGMVREKSPGRMAAASRQRWSMNARAR